MRISNNAPKQHITHRTIFLTVLWSFYRVILSKFFQQSLWAALHFRSRKYGSRPLSKRRDTHSLEAHEAQFAVFWLQATFHTNIQTYTHTHFPENNFRKPANYVSTFFVAYSMILKSFFFKNMMRALTMHFLSIS